jgi:cell division protein FtsX
MLGWSAFFILFRIGKENIKVPIAGVLLGIVGVIGTFSLVWSLYSSMHMPEFQEAFLIISKLSGFWSVLLVLGCVGCVRVAIQSYRVMRGA